MNEHSALIEYLRDQTFVSGEQLRVTPLAGGVSADVLLIEDADRKFVVKQSLAKLRVQDEWYCDTERTTVECQAIRFVSRFLPDNLPRILHFEPKHRLIVMEFLDKEFISWKSLLLQGNVSCSIGEQVAELLARIHSICWMDSAAKRQVDSRSTFYALRIEPYLLTTGRKHPELEQVFVAEARRLQNASLTLVHGDWSAKNLMVSPQKIVILDWEVASFGDPAFDAAFLFSLLYLKSLHMQRALNDYLELMKRFRAVYCREMAYFTLDLWPRTLHLTLLLMLARIDGKSPVEYINVEADKDVIRCFVRQALRHGIDNFEVLDNSWRKALAQG